VISPEGAASILWRDAAKASEAAAALKVTAQDLLALKLIDAIIPEPVGGAHRAPSRAIDAASEMIAQGLAELEGRSGPDLIRSRRAKYLQMGRGL
jgi:acetyl-CoA carboxylase carboxyl transferase subunit alpha